MENTANRVKRRKSRRPRDTMDMEFNRAVGKYMRSLRRGQKISAREMGDKIGVTFQQIQKYESGQNRLPLEKLLVALHYLKYPVYAFLTKVCEELEVKLIPTDIIILSREEHVSFIKKYKELMDGIQQLATYAKQVDGLVNNYSNF